MVVKTIVMMAMYLVPTTLLMFGLIESPVLAIFLYLISGLGVAGIGMGVMHDANHGAYSKNTFMNKLLSNTLDLLGCNSAIWRIQHNVLHHTYTNIDGHDEDIETPIFLLRFSPHAKKHKIQKIQHYYVWFFYGILTLYWVLWKDFYKAYDYYKKGLIGSKREYRMIYAKIILQKLIYFGYALVLPLMMAPFAPVWIIVGFILMHFMAGLLLSVVFQLAHVMPHTDFPQPDHDSKMNANWYTHQLQTTSNFAPKNKILFWYLGGLTNQIEHHLFPNICHVHYRSLSRIVARTAADFQIPYHVNKSFFAAVGGHVRMLRALGRVPQQ